MRHRRIAEAPVDENARRCDFAELTSAAKIDDRLRVVRADFTNRRDSTREPDVELVLKRLWNSAALFLNVRMRIDQSRHDVLASRIDLSITGRGTPCSSVFYGDGIEKHDLGDVIPFYDNVS